MGIFDIFNTDDQQAAAQAQIGGLNAANTQATGNINSAISGNNTGYAAALQPYLQNYGTANAGTTQLGNVLGLNGASGNATALNTLENTPGYQFQLQHGNASINAAAAANGTLNSGNQMLALSNYNQGLAGTTYNNYVNQLQPYLGASNAAAGGIAGVNTGQANANAGQYDQLAGLNYQTQTGIGNANANADLAGLTASGNIWNAIGGLGGMKTSGGGTVGGNLASSLGSSASSLGSSIMAMFSDERLKEDIEKVGELFDGSNVYRYRYIGDATPRIGLMAQEVEKTNPDAVIEIGGYKAVDYGKATQYASELSRFLEAA
jgi:hypothetical protein